MVRSQLGKRLGRRRGMAYILFAGLVMMVTVTGLAAMTAIRIERRTADNGSDAAAARFAAQAAVELGFLNIRDDPAWRTTYGTGRWFSNKALGDCTFDLDVQIVDDGDGQVNSNDPAIVIGTGMCGDSQHAMMVTVLPKDGGMIIDPGTWTQVVSGTTTQKVQGIDVLLN